MTPSETFFLVFQKMTDYFVLHFPNSWILLGRLCLGWGVLFLGTYPLGPRAPEGHTLVSHFKSRQDWKCIAW